MFQGQRMHMPDVKMQVLFVDLLKAVKAVNRKSRYYDTEARAGITGTDCRVLQP
jgi:hypothetical protein